MDTIQIAKQLTDIELLERMTFSNSTVFYEEFVSRYYDAVKRECLLKCAKRKLDKHIGEQIAHDTFERVRKTKSFKKQKLSQKEPRQAILAWLYRIQSNLFYDYHKSQNTSNESFESYFDEIAPHDSLDSASELLKKKDIAVRIFSKLSPKQKIVILKDLEHKRTQRYHSSDVLDDLAEELGVKKDSIRKIRERAIQKIKDAINEINQEK